LYINLFVIAELLGEVIIAVCGDPAFEQARSIIENRYCNDILIRMGHPSCLNVSKTIPRMLESGDRSSQFQRKLQQISQAMLLHRTSFALFQVYCECLLVRIQKISEPRQRAAELSKTITSFFDQNLDFDCYQMESYLDELTKLMRQFLTFRQSADVIVHLFLGRVPRFFPAFAELVKIVKAVRESESGSAKAGLPSVLESAEARLTRDSHKQAVRLLVSGAPIRDAMQLALDG
jgi:hypothetical protein